MPREPQPPASSAPRWLGPGLAVMVGASALGSSSCLKFIRIMEVNREAFLRREPHGLRTTRVGNRTLRFAVSGNTRAPPVLFIHGTPGSWDAFALFLNDTELRRRAFLISVDRPGFGGSDPGRTITSIGEQARLCVAVLEAARAAGSGRERREPADPEHGRSAIVVGHSWGGPIAARIAMDFPHQVRSLVLVAASIDPDLEEIRWYQHLARWKVFRWLVPRDLVTANEEVFSAKPELTQMVSRWKEIRIPVTVVQGEEDTLVPPANADFAARKLVSTSLHLERHPRVGHFVPWYRPELVRAAVLRDLDRSAPTPARN